MTPHNELRKTAPRNVQLDSRTLVLDINHSKLILNWKTLPSKFQDSRYLITDELTSPKIIVWLYTLRAIPNLKACQPIEQIKGVIIPKIKWDEIIAEAKVVQYQRTPPGPSRLYYLAPNLITLELVPESLDTYQYKFALNEATGNYGRKVTKTVELKFPAIREPLS